MWPKLGLSLLTLAYAALALGLLRDGTVHGPMNPNNLLFAAIHFAAAGISLSGLLVLTVLGRSPQASATVTASASIGWPSVARSLAFAMFVFVAVGVLALINAIDLVLHGSTGPRVALVSVSLLVANLGFSSALLLAGLARRPSCEA